MNYKNRFQFNSRLNCEGDYLVGQSFNLPNLRYYIQDRVWDFLRSFDCTTRSIRQNLLNHYKTKLNYLITLSESIYSITINLIKGNIDLLELIFEYTAWFQLNMNMNDFQIIYYTDNRNK